MYILGDIGNSETKIYLVGSNNVIIKNISLPTNKINNKNLKLKFKSLTKSFYRIEKVLFCSVVPKSFKQIKKFLSNKTKKKCYEVKDLKLKSLIKINVIYKQVGSDRLTNAISLSNNKDNFIILDLGTATTFDVIIKKTYKGGIIAPGIKISLNTLSDKATLIPQINLKKIKKVLGNDTVSAVRSGFFWGYAGLIDNIIYLIKKETKKSFKLVITGGFSDLFKKSIKNKFIHNKDITIKGLIKISKLIK
jgi:type III pantothenate kinase